MKGYGSQKRSRLLVIVALFLLVILVVVAYVYWSSLRNQGKTPGEGSLIPLQPTPIPMVRVLYAKKIVPADTILTSESISDNFDAREIPQTELLGADIVSSESQLANMVTRVELQPDQQLHLSQFVKATLSYLIPAGKRAMPFSVDAFTGIAKELAPQDYVDLVFSGQLELHFPQAFPPAADETTGALSPATLLSVKTILQNIQVIKIVPITTTTAAAPAPGGAQPTPTPAAAAGAAPPTGWTLILAVDDQQAEVIKLAIDQGWHYQLLLRPHGDNAVDTTTGATVNILVEKYGMPMPVYLPYNITPGEVPAGRVP